MPRAGTEPAHIIYRSLSSPVPDAADILALEMEELGGILLMHLKSYEISLVRVLQRSWRSTPMISARDFQLDSAIETSLHNELVLIQSNACQVWPLNFSRNSDPLRDRPVEGRRLLLLPLGDLICKRKLARYRSQSAQ